MYSHHQESYQQLVPRLPPPPPSPRTKPALKKTVSAPQAALARLLGGRGAPEEGRGGGEGDAGGGRAAPRKKPRSKRPVEVGEDVLASEQPPTPSPPVVPEGNLIDLDTDDASSASESPSATSLSSLPPSFRSGSLSTGARPSPQPRRRPPLPPTQRGRLATHSGAPTAAGSPTVAKTRPTPPPKPSYFSSSQTAAEPDSSQSLLAVSSDTNGTSNKLLNSVPSPYIAFTPLKKPKPLPPPPRSASQDSSSQPCTDTTPEESSHDSPSPDSSPTHKEDNATTTTTTTTTTTVSVQLHPVTFPNPPPREMEYTEREHSRTVFRYLDRMRERGDLCDVTLVGSVREFRAHKAVLAACSQYFESMFIGEFSEPDGEPIVVEEIEDDALEALVDFAYTSRIKLTDRNIYLIFSAADLLQFSGVRGACFRFFKQQMNKSNCIRTWLFGDGHNCAELTDAALRYIESNFLDVVRGREFLSLERADVVAKLLALEDIAVTSEEQVYEAALNWIRHAAKNRVSDAVEVMKSVRFPNMSREYLLHIVETEDLIKEDPQCLQMLIEALESFVSGTRTRLRKMMMKKREREAAAYVNLKPRNASMAVETVEVNREDQSLGLRIMGGSERPYHVFRQGDKPGVFILMVMANGAAERTGKLRTGDRILKVNDTDVSTATHDQAIRLLKTSPDPLSLLVRHEPAPTGLQELTLVTKPGEGFGLSLSGGVNGYHGNPLDETDEGIFISQIIPGGAAEIDGRLKEGTRILQVNSISMLGKTLAEALQVLQGVLDRINFLVCSGYDPAEAAAHQEGGGASVTETVDEAGCVVGSEALYDWRTGGGGTSDGLLV